MKRRTFLQHSLASSLAFSALPLLGATRRKKPYKLAIIGSGWWGMNILREAIAEGNSRVVGMCDVDAPQLNKAREEVQNLTGNLPYVYEDYEELLQKEKPEIVIVATPDHWHALAGIAAIQAGADVYLEKPISHTQQEGLAILQNARKYERVVQIGTHRRVSPHNMSAMEFLRSGKMGKIASVKTFVHYGWGGNAKPKADEAVPEGLNWDKWCGPAPYRPYNPAIHPKGFRYFLDYANGLIGDWGIHWFDQVLWWTEERHPKTVFSTGGRFIKSDGTDCPDTQTAIFTFEDFTMSWEHKMGVINANEQSQIGCYFYGTEGTLHLGWRDGWTFYPRKQSASPIHVDAKLNDPDEQNIKELWADFMRCVASRERPVCDIEEGYLATNMSMLGMISLKTGRSLNWDGENAKILDDPEASKLLRRPYRNGYTYPEIS